MFRTPPFPTAQTFISFPAAGSVSSKASVVLSKDIAEKVAESLFITHPWFANSEDTGSASPIVRVCEKGTVFVLYVPVFVAHPVMSKYSSKFPASPI